MYTSISVVSYGRLEVVPPVVRSMVIVTVQGLCPVVGVLSPGSLTVWHLLCRLPEVYVAMRISVMIHDNIVLDRTLTGYTTPC